MRSHVEVQVPAEVRQRGAVILKKPDSVEAIKASPVKSRVSVKGKIVKVGIFPMLIGVLFIVDIF